MGGSQVERAETLDDVAVAEVAVAAAVAEDGERSDVPRRRVVAGGEVGALVVEVDARLVRGAGVVDAVEDQVDARELLARLVRRELQRRRGVALHPTAADL